MTGIQTDIDGRYCLAVAVGRYRVISAEGVREGEGKDRIRLGQPRVVEVKPPPADTVFDIELVMSAPASAIREIIEPRISTEAVPADNSSDERRDECRRGKRDCLRHAIRETVCLTQLKALSPFRDHRLHAVLRLDGLGQRLGLGRLAVDQEDLLQGLRHRLDPFEQLALVSVAA